MTLPDPEQGVISLQNPDKPVEPEKCCNKTTLRLKGDIEGRRHPHNLIPKGT